MINLKSLIIITAITTAPLLTAQPRSSSSTSYETIVTIEHEAQDWITSQVTSLDYQDIQILANVTYLTYAESLFAVSVQREKRNLLLAMWHIYKEYDTYALDTYDTAGITKQLQKLQALVATKQFIHTAWQSCVTYIDQDDFKNTHGACHAAITAFINNAQKIGLAYVNDQLVELEFGLPFATNIIEHTDAIARETRTIARLAHNSTDPLETFDRILSLSPAVQTPCGDLIEIGMIIDEYQYRMLDTIKMTSIVYYKQLHTWMQQQEIPTHYQTHIFDGNGIIAAEFRTEPLQDPTYLAYVSE